MLRRVTHITSLLGCMLVLGTPAMTQAARPLIRPNIIVMMVDDMGFAGPSIAPYGNSHYKTPGMDRLAREGMLFTDFHASGAICSATRAGLVTGRYQQRAGIEAVIHPHANHPEHRKGLHEDEVTFAELFKKNGYSTGLIGKWHLGYAKETPKYHPMNHGFDYFVGYVSGNIDYINHWGDHMAHDWWQGQRETKEKGYTTHLINKYALEFIEQNKGRPFCLYIAHESPHAPVQGPQDPIQRGPGRQKRKTPHAEAMKQMILEMDKGVEQVRAKLVELGLDKNTLFLFFSDNGDAPGTATGSPRFRGHKGSVYEGGTRVPAIAWWPGRIKPGTRANDLSITLDVMPTILSVAGISPPTNRKLDGVDLSPVLFEQKPLPPRPLFWANLNNNGSRSEALRDGPWKLVVQHPRATPGTFENEKIELFNLAKDESEKNNLASAQPNRAATMLTQIKAWYVDTQKTASLQPGGWIPKTRTEHSFFNKKDLTGWRCNDGYWSVKDDAIIGHSGKKVPRNEFIWSDVEVNDFYLVVEVKLTPENRNAGIQFRSKSVNAQGQALGYQADVGAGVWGKLYHEHGRGKLDWNNRAAGIIKKGEWNRYEILASGHRIWTAINGKLCVAIDDPKGELSGKIAFQVHSGPPQTVHYKIVKLIHNPKVKLAGLTEMQLVAALTKKPSKKQATNISPLKSTPKSSPNAKQPKSGWTPEVIAWRKKLDANDPGMGKSPWFASDFKDAQWKIMSLPGHFERKGLVGHDGTVWYRRVVDIPAKARGKNLVLELGPIDDMDMTWFNGTQIGGIERPGFWAAPRKYTVPGKLVKAGRNIITVRVIDHGWSGGFAGNAGQMKLTGPGVAQSLAVPWRYKIGVTLKAIRLGALANPPPASVAKPLVPKIAPAASALLAPLAKPEKPMAPFTKGFDINSDQTIVIMGSTNALNTSHDGYLETLITAAWPQHQLCFRNMAWQADTIFLQQRPRNFYAANKPNYGERDGRHKTSADIVVFWMGQAESLDGVERLDAFASAYTKHLDQIAEYTHRIIIVTPVPFSDPLGLGLDLKKRNQSLAMYVKAIRKIAREKKLPVVDLFTAFQDRKTPGTYSLNGIYLSPVGHWFASHAFASQLGFEDRVASASLRETHVTLKPDSFEKLRQAIKQKNVLWFRYWRPTNWAFLYGNRQTQPSSRNHKNRGIRWFPGELEASLRHIKELENQVRNLAARAKK